LPRIQGRSLSLAECCLFLWRRLLLLRRCLQCNYNEFKFMNIWICWCSPLSIEINPKHPFTIRVVTLTTFVKLTSSLGKNSTTACCGEFGLLPGSRSAVRKTSARRDLPCDSSCEDVTKKRVRGSDPRYKCIALKWRKRYGWRKQF
jgi:hypothetical protein